MYRYAELWKSIPIIDTEMEVYQYLGKILLFLTMILVAGPFVIYTIFF
jgi:hypothetical protein